MNPFVKNLLSARTSLVADFSKQVAQMQHRLSQLDAMLGENEVDVSALPGLDLGAAPAVKRGRKAGGAKKAAKVAKVKKVKKAAKAAKAGRTPRNKGFNTTAAVRALVAGMKKPFTVADLREQFEKEHPGVLATLNRVALSLAMQSLGRKGEVTSKKDPKGGLGNIFTKTANLKA